MGARRIPIRGVGGAALVGAVLLSGCGAFEDPPEPTRLTAPPQEAPVETPSTTAEFTDADSRFAQLMVARHEQALELTALVPDRTDSPELLTLAEEIAAAQEPEIEQLRDQLQQWDLPADSAPEGRIGDLDTADLLSAEELEALAGATEAEFDRLWLEAMTAHHAGTVTLAQTEVADGAHEPTRRLAELIVSARQAEMARMQAMLGG